MANLDFPLAPVVDEIYSPAGGNQYKWDGLKWIRVGTKSSDIPVGSILLFDSDIAIGGFTLLTDWNDGVVFITSGSVAGGEPGASDKVGGTWTQPDHILDETQIPSHIHTATFTGAAVAAHQHNMPMSIAGPAAGWVEGGGTGGGPALTDPAGGGTPTGTVAVGAAGGSLGHNHGATWRPVGRNFTRQQKI